VICVTAAVAVLPFAAGHLAGGRWAVGVTIGRAARCSGWPRSPTRRWQACAAPDMWEHAARRRNLVDTVVRGGAPLLDLHSDRTVAYWSTDQKNG
jgi:hypothetical protein